MVPTTGSRREDQKSSPLSCDETTSSHGTTGLSHIDTLCNTVCIKHDSVSIEDVYDGVYNGRTLGTGASGVVRLVTHRESGVKYAVKCIDFGLIEREGLKRFREEIYIMCQIDHPNIIRLEEVYESPKEIFLVMELCLGGELFEQLDEQPDYHYSEDECQKLVKQMLVAVQYLHSKGIIHRDLKLENFLFYNEDDNLKLKLIDFGLSKFYRVGDVNDELVGTPYTIAPELIKRMYDERCDIWAMGVITYLLLCGDAPFGGCDRDGAPVNFSLLKQNILNVRYDFAPEDIWDEVSDEAKDFIRSLLVADPQERPSAAEAQKLPWLEEWAKKDPNTNQVLNPDIIEALVEYQDYTDVRKLLCKTLTYALYPFWFTDSHEEFQKLGMDHCEINFKTFSKVVTVENHALKTDDILNLFESLCVRETVDTFQRQDFYAAGLSHCEVDDTNLCYAFDRIDLEHNGYITCNDIVKVLGNDGITPDDSIREMYSEPLQQIEKMDNGLSCKDFVSMVKGV